MAKIPQIRGALLEEAILFLLEKVGYSIVEFNPSLSPEETGLKVEVKQLVGVFTRMPSIINGPHTMIAIVHLCEVHEGELALSHEGLALRYWQIDKVQNWHANHKKYAQAAYKIWRSNHLLTSISD